MEEKYNIQQVRITSYDALTKVESEYCTDRYNSEEFIAYAKNTSYEDIARNVKPDKFVINGDIPDKENQWVHPLVLTHTKHRASIGIKDVGRKAIDYINEMPNAEVIDVLSVKAVVVGEEIELTILARPYDGKFNFVGFFEFIGEKITRDPEEEKKIIVHGRLIVPDEIKNFKYDEKFLKAHEKRLKTQKEIMENCSEEIPFLNQLDSYEREVLPHPKDSIPLIYDLEGYNRQLEIYGDYDEFESVFNSIMREVNGTGKYDYFNVLHKGIGEAKTATEEYMAQMEKKLITNFVDTKILRPENLSVMLKKLRRSLFQLYIVQDLIDDPQITDIKICDPHDISVRVKGGRYSTNVSFINDADYDRFCTYLYERNHLDPRLPKQIFTYNYDEDFILRFTIYPGYISANRYPLIHIRKVSRHKLLKKELIEKGFFPEKVADWIIDCARKEGGIDWVGRPGSGKTVGLNWMIEDGYEQSAEVLVIQETNELFTYHKGYMFQNVVEYSNQDQQAVDLEDLGQMALVAGANVFVIGETKGPEVCAALTLGLSGCRVSSTLHTYSASEGWSKIANLAMKGNYSDYDLAMEDAVKCFKTMIYCENFKVKQIVQATGYDRTTHKVSYKCIYRYEEQESA
ncbi:MAG: Flp pilus assembly complex ATPase component TadA [Lachnospiraceae bacterium]|nr:Flp pilus assembly complex ATPase component TadA [Lachnospiraceae bacterium]